ncbi:TPA: DUF4400 domain-containing protein [Pseudomonas aeruginosa]
MADTIEEKWPKGVFASILFFFVLILMLATAAPNTWVDRVMLKERAWGVSLLGGADMARMEEKTRAWFTALVLDSGAKAMVSDVFMQKSDSRGTVDALERKTRWWFDYLDSRGVALQKIVYQMLYRMVLTMFWLPLLGVVVVPAVYAGWMRWHAKREGFNYTSPFLNNHATNLLSWGTVLLVLSVLCPLPLPPLMISTFIIVMVPILLSLLISNLPKKF